MTYTAQHENFVRLMLPKEVGGSYDLAAEFSRTLGSDSVTVTFPVISRLCTLHFSALLGWQGGLERIDSRDVVKWENPAVRRPNRLVNGRPYPSACP